MPLMPKLTVAKVIDLGHSGVADVEILCGCVSRRSRRGSRYAGRKVI